MVEDNEVAANLPPYELLGKEVTVTHVEKELLFPYREFILEAIPVPEENDYVLVIGIKSRRKNPKYSGYKCRYSEVVVVPVDEGETVDFESEEIQSLIRRLNQT